MQNVFFVHIYIYTYIVQYKQMPPPPKINIRLCPMNYESVDLGGELANRSIDRAFELRHAPVENEGSRKGS